MEVSDTQPTEVEVSQKTINRILNAILFALFVAGVIVVLSMDLPPTFSVIGLVVMIIGYFMAAAGND